MKYKVGDRVRIKPDFNLTNFPGNPGVVTEMLPMMNEVVTIREVRPQSEEVTWYFINDDYWTWDERWLEPESEEMEVKFTDVDLISVLKGS